MFFFQEVSHALSSDDDKHDESNTEKIVQDSWRIYQSSAINANMYLMKQGRKITRKPRRFQLKQIALKMSDLAQELVKYCSLAIENIREEELAIGFPIEIENGDLVSNDPIKRPKDLTDNQRKFLIWSS